MDVTISTPVGGMPGYLSRPGGDGRWPGVVVLHDGFGIDEAVRAQADWPAAAGYLALSADLGIWGRPSACLLRMFRDLPVGRGQTFGQVDAARDWLAGQPECDGRPCVIGFCATGGFALLMAAGHGFSVSSVNYRLAGKNAQDALDGACPIVASFGAGTGSCGTRRSVSAGRWRRSGSTTTSRCTRTPGTPSCASPEVSRAIAGLLARITHAGYHEPSAHDARARIIAFFHAHLKT